jgi:hypothetical protein
MTTYIIQNGTDGVGHQLHGMFTLMILHNVNGFKFDIDMFRKKTFRYEHIDVSESQQMTNYIKQVCECFIQDNGFFENPYTKKIMCRSISDVKSGEDTINVLDNMFSFNNLDNTDTISKNIARMKEYFINDKLPPNRVGDNTIVVHIRLGDAIRYTDRRILITKLNNQLNQTLKILNKKYPEYAIRVHTDGTPEQIQSLIKDVSNVQAQWKNTNILEVLSDLIHTKILVCGSSSLSIFSGFMGDKELVIHNDDPIHVYPDHAIEISSFLKTNYDYD